jgi:hypothetical protein
MKRFFTALFCLFTIALQAQNYNLTLRSTLPYNGVLANIGGYVDVRTGRL